MLVLWNCTSASSSWWTNLIPSAPFSCIMLPFKYARSDELFRYMPYPGRESTVLFTNMNPLETF
jgi:hypothetical protein